MHALGLTLALIATTSLTVPVTVDAGFKSQNLGRHLSLLRDPQRLFKPAEVLRGEHDAGFVDSRRDEIGLGYDQAAFWIRFAIDNRSSQSLPLMLELSYPALDDVQLFEGRQGGDQPLFRSGSVLDFSSRPRPTRSHVFPLTVVPGRSSFLLRVESDSPVNVPLMLYSPAAFDRKIDLENIVLWMFYGLLGGMLLYNFFLFSSVRDSSYLFYGAYILSFGLFLFCHNGLAKRYLWPWAGDLNHRVMIAAAYAATVAAVQFGRRFLDTPHVTPRIDLVLRILQAFGAVAGLVFVVTYVGFLERGGAGLLAMVTVLLLIAGVLALQKGYGPARFYVLAWSLLLVGIGTGLLKALGWLPVNFWTNWGYQIAAAVEAILLSLALADRINHLRQQTEELNKALAGKVEERTRRLKQASTSLAQQGHEIEETGARLLQEVRDRVKAEDERNLLHAQLLQAQKMEAIGRLAGGVAHDINNVLGAVMGFASLAADAVDPAHPARQDLGEILGAAARGRDLTDNLLGFARKGNYMQRLCNVNELVLEVTRLLERTALKRARLEQELHPTPLRVLGDPSELSQAIMNLCINALDAMPEEGLVALRTEVVVVGTELQAVLPPLKPGRYARIQVRDTGCGMDESIRARALEPFFTTKPQGEGTGLGLAIVYGTAVRHSGGIQLDSTPGVGTSVWLWLPLAEETAPVDVEVPVSDELLQGTGTILIVDDEDNVRLALRRMLERLGYQVHDASSASDAVVDYAEHWQDTVLVVLDLRMPKVDGRALLAKLKAFNPAVRVLLCTGFGSEAELVQLLAEGVRGILPKPFTLQQLSSALRRILDEDAGSATGTGRGS